MVARDFPAPVMQRKKRLALALRAIWQRHPRSDVRDLLWAIYRLQDIAWQAYGVGIVAGCGVSIGQYWRDWTRSMQRCLPSHACGSGRLNGRQMRNWR